MKYLLLITLFLISCNKQVKNDTNDIYNVLRAVEKRIDRLENQINLDRCISRHITDVFSGEIFYTDQGQRVVVELKSGLWTILNSIGQFTQFDKGSKSDLLLYLKENEYSKVDCWSIYD